jgi:hypothetical protein
MVMQQLQGLLARLYDVPNEYAVADFLVTDRQQLAALGLLDADERISDEQVLVCETQNGPRVCVYLAGEVLARLSKNNPLDSLSEENLADYCTAIEGVSHFHYLTWRATHGEPVSLLELELQADVDKYAAALWLLTAQRCGRYPRTLHERLFDRVSYLAELSVECLARYRQANRFAARFCRRLDEQFLRRRRAHPEGWVRELRRFYRLRHAQKLQCAAD